MVKRERKQPERLGASSEPSPKKVKSPTPASKAQAKAIKNEKGKKQSNRPKRGDKDDPKPGDSKVVEETVETKVVVEKKVKVTKKEAQSEEAPSSPKKTRGEGNVAASPKLPALPEKKNDEDQGESSEAPKRGKRDGSKAKLPRATSGKKVKKVNPAHHREVRKSTRKFFTQEEITALTEGVKEFGEGKWSKIKNAHPEIFADRTSLDLKDKWRNIKKRPTASKGSKDNEGSKKRARKDSGAEEPGSPKKSSGEEKQASKRGRKKAEAGDEQGGADSLLTASV